MGWFPHLRPLRILLVTPVHRSGAGRDAAWTGNRVTARRYAGILRALGHRVTLAREYRGGGHDLLVALHARKSFESIVRFRREHPDALVVVVLTGTDLYDGLRRSTRARRSLELASRIVVLQPLGVRSVPSALRRKVHVIRQSAARPARRFEPRRGAYEVCVLSNLRAVKDPFRIAQAVRLLPPSSSIVALHLGAALDERLRKRAQRESAANRRYRWLGAVPRGRALRILARSRLLVLTSRLEGGANVVSEALRACVPVISSRIAGSVGILGPHYPGYFPVGNARALAALLRRAEADPPFYRRLKRRCGLLYSLVSPVRERRSWARLLLSLKT